MPPVAVGLPILPGDSVLAEFGSAVDAVQCAVEAQAALSQANVGLSPDRHINFRIGVHVGDVMIKGGVTFLVMV